MFGKKNVLLFRKSNRKRERKSRKVGIKNLYSFRKNSKEGSRNEGLDCSSQNEAVISEFTPSTPIPSSSTGSLDAPENVTPQSGLPIVHDDECDIGVDIPVKSISVDSVNEFDANSISSIDDDGKEDEKSARISVDTASALREVALSRATKALKNSNWIVKQDDNVVQSFVLLLQPKARIFELILISYSKNNTTIGALLNLIPLNATEPILVAQCYTGFYKLNDGIELVEQDQKLSDSTETGDILVAIPSGYDGVDVKAFSSQILQNKNVKKLLRKLHPTKKLKRLSKKVKKHNTVNDAKSYKECVTIKACNLNDIKTRNGISCKINIGNGNDNKMKSAFKQSIGEGAVKQSMDATSDTCSGTISLTEYSGDSTVEVSKELWSKSFESSLASEPRKCTISTTRASRTKRCRNIQKVNMIPLGLATYSTIHYMLTSDGFLGRVTRNTNKPLGVAGALQCLFLITAIVSIQKHMSKEMISKVNNDELLKAFFGLMIKSTKSKSAAVGGTPLLSR